MSHLSSMAVWPWLVRHSAWLVERYQMRANGRTSYQDCFSGIVLRFGEQAVFRHPVGTAAGRNRQTFKQLRKEKAAKKMDLGIWLGKTYETDEHYMGTSDGNFIARTCRRMPSDGQWKLDAVKAVTGVPWNMGAGRRHARVQVLPSLPEAPTHSQPPESGETAAVPPVPPPAPPPPAPSDPVPMAPMTVDDEQTRVHEWRRHAKRQAEVLLEDLNPAMVLCDDTPGV